MASNYMEDMDILGATDTEVTTPVDVNALLGNVDELRIRNIDDMNYYELDLYSNGQHIFSFIVETDRRNDKIEILTEDTLQVLYRLYGDLTTYSQIDVLLPSGLRLGKVLIPYISKSPEASTSTWKISGGSANYDYLVHDLTSSQSVVATITVPAGDRGYSSVRMANASLESGTKGLLLSMLIVMAANDYQFQPHYTKSTKLNFPPPTQLTTTSGLAASMAAMQLSTQKQSSPTQPAQSTTLQTTSEQVLGKLAQMDMSSVFLIKILELRNEKKVIDYYALANSMTGRILCIINVNRTPSNDSFMEVKDRNMQPLIHTSKHTGYKFKFFVFANDASRIGYIQYNRQIDNDGKFQLAIFRLGANLAMPLEIHTERFFTKRSARTLIGCISAHPGYRYAAQLKLHAQLDPTSKAILIVHLVSQAIKVYEVFHGKTPVAYTENIVDQKIAERVQEGIQTCYSG